MAGQTTSWLAGTQTYADYRGDAYYFTVITLTTIGYGDLNPTIPLTKFFTTVYVFVGLGIVAGLIGLVGEAVINDANRTTAEREIKSEG